MNIDWLLYFSIGCFCLAFIGSLIEFIEWLIKPVDITPVGAKPSQFNIFQQVKNAVTPPKYELTVSYIEYCREVVRWSGPILKEYGIKFYPKVAMKYGSGTRTMGTYCSSQNLVTINLNSHDRRFNKTLLETIASTTLHEIFHHIQSKKDPDYKALTNYKKYGYWGNRLEVEARSFESKWYMQCFEDMVAKGIIRKII
jgi:hypothetical protein